jgi:small-conductance mechanosensitive channel
MNPPGKLRTSSFAPGLVLLLALAGAADAQAPTATGKDARSSAPAIDAVPDPAGLAPDWWNYLAQGGPELRQRVSALLGQAGATASQLPAADADAGGQALERLRIGLSALPDMLAATPAAPPPAPAPADGYTTRQVLDLDRTVRDLQLELDERRSAMAAAARALKESRRQLDAGFAAYLAARGAGSDQALRGLELMATRTEIAVAEAEQQLREAENAQIVARVREISDLRRRAIGLLTEDPERDSDRLRELVLEAQRKLGQQREEILRARAARSSLASTPGVVRAQLELADLKITAATIEEGLLSTRIDLLETEIDWLTARAGPLDLAAVTAMQKRLAERRQQAAAVEGGMDDWVAMLQRIIASSLRTPGDALPEPESRARRAALDLAQKTIPRLVRLRSLLADLRFAAAVSVDLLAEAGGWRGWARSKVLNPALALVADADQALRASLFRIGDTPVTTYGLLRILLFLALAVVGSRLLRRLLARIGDRDPGRSGAGLYTVGRLLHYVLIAAALIAGLASIGLDFSRLALVAGALSIGIGFGLQSIVNNFVSGLMILFEQNIKVGDVVELDSGVRGVVKEINVRSTLITTSDAVDIVVPNSEFISGRVTNYTLQEPYHRIHVPFGVAYGSDKDEVRRIIIDAAKKLPFTHARPGREPDVWLVKFGDNSLDFELVVWINPGAVTRPGAVMASYLWEIETTLRTHGIQIPFPQRDVRLTVTGSEPAALAGAAQAVPSART